ncbi:MAG: amino acid kinase family protein [Planctomycetota bacterium]|jgi:uridylate kinase
MGQEGAAKRVLLKISGNAFAAPEGAPFDEGAIDYIVAELRAASEADAQLAVVVGGGNIIRGARFCPSGAGRIKADYAGMLATVINALVLADRLGRSGVPISYYGAFPVPRMMPIFEPARCVADLEEGKTVLLAGGTGNPLLTTDTAAAIRAVEVGADLVLKATRVDGVYSADPEADPDARLYERISCREVLEQKLGIMDLTAVSFCLEHGLAVRVFNYGVEGNIRRAAAGEAVGTLIGGE